VTARNNIPSKNAAPCLDETAFIRGPTMPSWTTDKRVIAGIIIVLLVLVTVLAASGIISGFLLTLFIWPSGIVVGNLIASAMWQPSWFLSLHKKTNTQTRVLSEQAERHHKEKMDLSRQQHEELKKHITDTHRGKGKK
jgi:hypothetical protein